VVQRIICLLLVGTTLSGCVSVPKSRSFTIMVDSEAELARLNHGVRGRDVWMRTDSDELVDAKQLVVKPDTSTFLACEPWVPGPSLVSKTSSRRVPTPSIRVIGASRSNEGFLRGMAEGAVIGALASSLTVYLICDAFADALGTVDKPEFKLFVSAGGLCIAAVIGGVIGSNRAGTDLYQLTHPETTPR